MDFKLNSPLKIPQYKQWSFASMKKPTEHLNFEFLDGLFAVPLKGCFPSVKKLN